jgi:hypothetical protein
MNRSRTSIIVLALPFAMMTAVFIARLIVGPGWGLLPLLAIGPAIAAPLAGMAYTVAAGAVALGACVPFLLGSQSAVTYHPAQIALVAVIGVTTASILATRRRQRTDQMVADIRLVADVAQRVLLRPIPRQAGPVQVAVRYLSARAQRPCSACSARLPMTRTAWPRSWPGSRPAWPAIWAPSSS